MIFLNFTDYIAVFCACKDVNVLIIRWKARIITQGCASEDLIKQEDKKMTYNELQMELRAPHTRRTGSG